MTRYTLSKGERLASQRAIEALFAGGQSLAKFPIRLVWRTLAPDEPAPTPVQVLFSVSKKKFPRAVDRNRVKRLLRESYRHLKPELYGQLTSVGAFHLAIIYSGQDLPTADTVRRAMHVVMERWLQQLLTKPTE